MGALSSLATLGLNLAVARQADRRRSRAIDADRDRQIDTIQTQGAEARRQQEERLRQAQARERARAGAAGILGPGSSAEAILRGLTEESDLALQAREQESARRVEDIARSAREARRRSLLDLSDNLLRTTFARGSGLRSLLD
jgi:hypothetical protein